MSIIAVVPVSGSDLEYKGDTFLTLNNKNIIDYTLDILVETNELVDIVVSTDSAMIAEYVKEKHQDVKLYLRDSDSKNRDLPSVIEETISDYQQQYKTNLDYVLQAWINYPFRKHDLFNRVIKIIKENPSIDSLFCSASEFNTYWFYDGSEVSRITSDVGRSRKAGKPILRDLKGLCSIAKITNIENGYFIGGDIATYNISDPLCTINIHEYQDLYIAKMVAKLYDPYTEDDLEINKNDFIPDEQLHTSKKRSVLAAKRFLPKGTVLSEDDLIIIQSDLGIGEDKLENILNKTLVYDLEENKALTFGWLV